MNAEVQRQMMVDGQIRTNEVSDPALLEALYDLPREIFVPKDFSAVAYADREIALADGRFLLTPMVAAKLIQALTLSPGEKVLDIAGGTGYSAALMAKTGAEVIALEDSAALSDAAKANFSTLNLGNITSVTGSLTDGAVRQAPFDAILINGAVDSVPETLLAQLTERGRLIAVLGQGRSGKAVIFERSGSTYGSRNLFDAAASPLAAFQKTPEFEF